MNILKRISCYINNIKNYGMFYIDMILLSDYIAAKENTKLSVDIPTGKRIAIYGFGPYGQYYFIKTFSNFRIMGIFDINYEYIGWPIRDPEKIETGAFDYIIVTVMNNNARNSVTNLLIKKGIKEENIVYADYLEK